MPPIDRVGPVRSCVGCRSRRPSCELVRLTRSTDGVVVDGPSRGRGAWLCRDEHGADERCAERALSRRAFARAWRTTLDDDDIEAIRDALRHHRGRGGDPTSHEGMTTGEG